MAAPKLPLTIPATRFNEFERLWKMKMFSEHLRWGQALFNYLDLHKMQRDYESDDKIALDRLYNADFKTAYAMVQEVIDWEN